MTDPRKEALSTGQHPRLGGHHLLMPGIFWKFSEKEKEKNWSLAGCRSCYSDSYANAKYSCFWSQVKRTHRLSGMQVAIWTGSLRYTPPPKK